MTTILKWIGGITAVLSLVFAIHQFVQILGDVREQHRQVAELNAVGKREQTAGNYAMAWDSFTKAVKTAEGGGQLAQIFGLLSKDQRTSRKAQEDLAMAWMENIVVPQGKTFSDIVDKLIPVLDRGVEEAYGKRKADLIAHLGWANFLKSRDGILNLDIVGEYREALRLDPGNPYAHAMWGHWLMANGDHLNQAERHFSIALKNGRAHHFVYNIELGPLRWVDSRKDVYELIRVCNRMRKEGEAIPEVDRSRILNDVYFGYSKEVNENPNTILPPSEHLNTFLWLLKGLPENEQLYWKFFHARLSEADGQCRMAQPLYASLIAIPHLASRLKTWAGEGLQRCEQSTPHSDTGHP